MNKERVDALIDYLQVLADLRADGFQATKEILGVMKAISDELLLNADQ